MDLIPALFLLGIVLASGFIAVFADHLGRRLGKLRLTFLRMRPRHTAMLGVFLSGLLASVLTIALVSAFSAPVRQWIVEGSRAIERARLADSRAQTAETRLKDLQTREADLVRRNERLTAFRTQQESQLRRLAEDIERRRREADRLVKAVAQAERRIGELNVRLTRTQSSLVATQRSLQGAEVQVRRAQAQVAQAKQEFANAQRERNYAQREYNDVSRRNAELESVAAGLEANVQTLARSVRELDTQALELRTQQRDLNRVLEDSRAQLSNAQNELEARRQELDEVTEQFALARAFSNTVSQTFITARQSGMTYRLGDEVARVVFPPQLSSEEAREAVARLLAIARENAERRGARGNGPYASADLIDRRDRQGNTVTGSQLQAGLVGEMVGRPESGVLVATSTMNAFEGEPVSLEVQVLPNPVVFKQGEVLSQTRIDGRRSQIEVFRQINEFLASKVREVAADRLIPRRGSDATYGEVSPDEVFDIVERVRREDRAVMLRANAVADTRAADPLRLRFTVR